MADKTTKARAGTPRVGGKKPRVVLASRSPRRRELLSRLGVSHKAVAPDIDETPRPGEKARAYVVRMAEEKAAKVAAAHPDAVVIAADTAVEIDGRILGQPADEEAARRMLNSLSDRTHKVHTAVARVAPDGSRSLRTTSVVRFRPVNKHLREWYLQSGEWQGKAGGYAIQGRGGTLVTTVEGSLSGVVGLPLRETAELLGLVAPGSSRTRRLSSALRRLYPWHSHS